MNKRGRGFWLASVLSVAACGEGSAGPGEAAEPEAQADDSASEDAASPSDDADPEPCDIPAEPGAMLAYLRSGGYKGFARESSPHASTGPHGGRVLTYVNDILAASLEAENVEHPRCAASVKELWLGNSEVSGWAVFVKTEQRSAQGQGYYWYEITSTQSGARTDYEGQGIQICVGCHSVGRDNFRAPWPLQ